MKQVPSTTVGEIPENAHASRSSVTDKEVENTSEKLYYSKMIQTLDFVNDKLPSSPKYHEIQELDRIAINSSSNLESRANPSIRIGDFPCYQSTLLGYSDANNCIHQTSISDNSKLLNPMYMQTKSIRRTISGIELRKADLCKRIEEMTRGEEIGNSDWDCISDDSESNHNVHDFRYKIYPAAHLKPLKEENGENYVGTSINKFPNAYGASLDIASSYHNVVPKRKTKIENASCDYFQSLLSEESALQEIGSPGIGNEMISLKLSIEKLKDENSALRRLIVNDGIVSSKNISESRENLNGKNTKDRCSDIHEHEKNESEKLHDRKFSPYDKHSEEMNTNGKVRDEREENFTYDSCDSSRVINNVIMKILEQQNFLADKMEYGIMSHVHNEKGERNKSDNEVHSRSKSQNSGTRNVMVNDTILSDGNYYFPEESRMIGHKDGVSKFPMKEGTHMLEYFSKPFGLNSKLSISETESEDYCCTTDSSDSISRSFEKLGPNLGNKGINFDDHTEHLNKIVVRLLRKLEHKKKINCTLNTKLLEEMTKVKYLENKVSRLRNRLRNRKTKYHVSLKNLQLLALSSEKSANANVSQKAIVKVDYAEDISETKEDIQQLEIIEQKSKYFEVGKIFNSQKVGRLFSKRSNGKDKDEFSEKSSYTDGKDLYYFLNLNSYLF